MLITDVKTSSFTFVLALCLKSAPQYKLNINDDDVHLFFLEVCKKQLNTVD